MTQWGSKSGLPAASTPGYVLTDTGTEWVGAPAPVGTVPTPGPAGDVLVSDGMSWLSQALGIADVGGLTTALSLKANIASPTFTGVPAGPTAAPGTNSPQLATTAYADAGVALEQAARVAADALKANIASPVFTGVPSVPTAAPGTATTQAASTAFAVGEVALEAAARIAADALKANIASPTFTGIPSVPTAAPGTATTQAASTAFVTAADSGLQSQIDALAAQVAALEGNDMQHSLDAFGRLRVSQDLARVQLSAPYNVLQASDHFTYVINGGTCTVVDQVMLASSGGTIGGIAQLSSRRIITYRPGQANTYSFTSRFSTPLADTVQWAGAIGPEESIVFGYLGTTFGVIRAKDGKAQIMRLTLSAGTTGSETITITLNSEVLVFSPISGGLSPTVLAETLARQTYANWYATANGATITFVSRNPGPAGGTYAFSSSGSAAGTYTTLAVGAALDAVTGFVPQAFWNVDKMDGTGPSGVTADWSKLNVFQIKHGHLGAAPIQFEIMTAAGWQTVHVADPTNVSTLPSQRFAIYNLGWVAVNAGGGAVTCGGASAAAFIGGTFEQVREPTPVSALSITSQLTPYVCLIVRLRFEYNNLYNLREAVLSHVRASVETNNRRVIFRLIREPTSYSGGTLLWQYVNQGESCIEYAIPTPGSITVSGGKTIDELPLVGPSSAAWDMDTHTRLRFGETLAIVVQSTGGSADGSISLNFDEG